MKRIVILIAVPIMLASLVSLASAAGFELGAKLGYTLPTGDHGDDWEGGFKYGIYGQYNFTPSFAGQLVWVRAKNVLPCHR